MSFIQNLVENRGNPLLPAAPNVPAPAEPRNVAHRMTHLRALEAESIHILREGMAESKNPVLLYSIGKDSSVLLHLAMKAFAPGRLPFPILHVDTRWKFREMIAFRDTRVAELGLDLVTHINPDGVARGIGPLTHGTDVRIPM